MGTLGKTTTAIRTTAVIAVTTAALTALTGLQQPASAAPLPDLHCRGKLVTIVGTPGDDKLIGTPSADVIVALGGNDVIHSRGGNDTVCGGRGHDVIYTSTGRDVVNGGKAHDHAETGGGMDTCWLVEDAFACEEVKI